MRNMNCRDVRREIDEAGPGDLLSLAVNTHIEECVACETISREQSKLQAITSSLGTVEVPGDFDFRLRARLAGERNGTARPFALGEFSFGFRSIAIAMLLVVIGAAFAIVSFRTRQDNPVANGFQAGSKPVTPPSAVAVEGGRAIKGNATDLALGPQQPQQDMVAPDVDSRDPKTPKRRVGRDALAASRGSNVGTRDISSTQAKVFKALEASPVSYPTAAFPIDASYQSLKMSVDDGRGSSRTISLPTVSFGSQRTLSQGASPLLAAARGAW